MGGASSARRTINVVSVAVVVVAAAIAVVVGVPCNQP